MCILGQPDAQATPAGQQRLVSDLVGAALAGFVDSHRHDAAGGQRIQGSDRVVIARIGVRQGQGMTRQVSELPISSSDAVSPGCPRR